MDNLQLTIYKLQLTNREAVEPDCRDETQKTHSESYNPGVGRTIDPGGIKRL